MSETDAAKEDAVNALSIPAVDFVAMRREDYTGPQMATNLPMTTPKEKALVVNILNGKHTPLEEVNGKVVELIGYVVTRDLFTATDETEAKPTPKVHLLTKSGERLFAIGRSAVKCCGDIIQVFGQQHWNPPIKAVFSKERLHGGNEWWNVEIDV